MIDSEHAPPRLEELDADDERVNRALRWREIERHLDGVSSVLDVGGGTGAFSIPLARRGLAVTHVDVDPQALARAREAADGLPNLRFVQANAIDLSVLDPTQYDLVLNLDGAVSFCGAQATTALAESARLTARTLIVTVSHRAWMAAQWLAQSLDHVGEVVPAVVDMMERGKWDPAAPGLGEAARVGALQSFLPDELAGHLRRAGLYVERVGGLGSLSLLAGAAALRRVQDDDERFRHFVDLCDRFDRSVMPHGPGTRQRAGLIAVAHRRGLSP
jgi:SAM-dependent methyltransferase